MRSKIQIGSRCFTKHKGSSSKVKIRTFLCVKYHRISQIKWNK